MHLPLSRIEDTTAYSEQQREDSLSRRNPAKEEGEASMGLDHSTEERSQIHVSFLSPFSQKGSALI